MAREFVSMILILAGVDSVDFVVEQLPRFTGKNGNSR
jgi:hypothetical protein